jgi:hypothetical protein
MAAMQAADGSTAVYRMVPRSVVPLGMLLPAALFANGLFMTLIIEAKPARQALPELVLAAVAAYILSHIPHTIVLRDADACVEFRCFWRTHLIPVANMRRIGPSRLLRGGYDVTHALGSQWVVASLPELEEIVCWIRPRNPSVTFEAGRAR